MSKFLYPIRKLKIEPWIKYWLINKTRGEQGTLSEIIEGTSPLTLANSIKKKFHLFNVGGNTKQATAILPEEYQQVDYIESSGTQYIDTGIESISKTFEIDMKFKIAQSKSFQNLFCCRNSSYSRSCFINDLTGFRVDQNNNQNSVARGIALDTIYELISSQKAFKLNNQELKTFPDNSGNDINAKVTILNSYDITNGTMSDTYGFIGKLYTCKIYDNDTLVRNFIPCYRKTDNVVGLYDLVNGVFYTNAGTGAFTYGTAVTLPNPDYPIEVENVSGEVEVKVENKNFIDLSSYSGTHNEDGSLTVNNTSSSAIAGITVILTGKIPAGTYKFSNISGGAAFLQDKTHSGYTTQINVGSTFTVEYDGESTLRFVFANQAANSTRTYKLQLEPGSTATSYEPHEEQTATFPLAQGQVLHLGDTLEDDGIHQKRNATIFDSSASIIYSSTNLAFSIMMPSNYNNRGIVFCNKYKYNNTAGTSAQLSNYECTGLGGNGKYFHLKDNRFSTSTEFKNYIIEQYEAGTPLIVEYELATEIIIPYTAEQQTAYNNLKNLYSYKGTTHISSSNEPSPVFEVQYYMEGE